jgi:hypothetical protein
MDDSMTEICEKCGYEGEKWQFHTHHIDRNRKNNHGKNLVRVCIKCHHIIHKLNETEFKPFVKPEPGAPILSKEIVDDLPTYYRVLARFLAEKGKVIIS